MTIPASTLLQEFTVYSMSEHMKRPGAAFDAAVQGIHAKQDKIRKTFARDNDVDVDSLSCRIQSISHDLLFFPGGFLSSAEYQVSIVATLHIFPAFDDFQDPTSDES